MKIAALALVLLPLAACGPTPAKTPERPPVVMIVVDSLRKDHLSCYGYPEETSPELDRLAAASLRYDNAISSAPWTLPAVSSMLSSRWPSELGIKNKKSMLGRQHLLLSEVLQDAGYRTGAVISHKFVAGQWGFDQGFDVFDETNVLGHRGISSPGITAKAIEFLDTFKDESFFLFLHYFDPHFDYIAHEDHAFPEPNVDHPLAGEFAVASRVSRYNSEIAWTDKHIGRVIERLRELELFEHTLITFTADHGEEFLDHDQMGHTKTLYQELVNVPLLVKFPQGTPGVVSEPVAIVDLYPTVLETLGIAIPDHVTGGVLSPDRAVPSGRGIFTETSSEANLRGLVAGTIKVIKDLETGEVRGYDLAADPLERSPLAATDPRVAPHAAELEAWIAALPEIVAEETTLSAEQEDDLEKLGYGGSGDH